MAGIPSDQEIMAQVKADGYTGNDAVLQFSIRKAAAMNTGQSAGAYNADALRVMGTPAGRIGKYVSVNPGTTSSANPSGGSGSFSSILDLKLWKRIGVGALGMLMLYLGSRIIMRDEAKMVLGSITKDALS